MIGDIGQIAAAVVTTLAPFTPFLLDVGKAGGKKLAEVIAEKGGEVAWNKAQAVWNVLKAHFGADQEVISAVGLVAAKPHDETYQTLLVKVLGTRIQADPELAQQILQLLGGQQGVKQVLADRSLVEDITQKGPGSKKVQARKSIVRRVSQED